MDNIERIQRYATGFVERIRRTDHHVRLRVVHLFPMLYRRHRGDLISLCNILHDDMRSEIHAEFPLCSCDRTRDRRLTYLSKTQRVSP